MGHARRLGFADKSFSLANSCPNSKDKLPFFPFGEFGKCCMVTLTVPFLACRHRSKMVGSGRDGTPGVSAVSAVTLSCQDHGASADLNSADRKTCH